jgi:uncharacterized protein (TIGR02996 family)
MPTPDDLLAAVIADPDADAPRLAYADWLDAHGDAEAAEFIRVQIEVASGLWQPSTPRLVELAAREKVLLASGNAWIDAPLLPGTYRGTRHRGFHDHLLTNLPTFIRHADELFRRGPIRRVELMPPFDPELMSAVAALPQLARVRDLYVAHSRALSDEGAEALLFSEFLTGVRFLHFGRQNLTARGVAAVANACSLGGVERLVLFDNPIGSAGAAALAASPVLRGLRDVSLDNCGIGAAGAEVLAASPVLASVLSLSLESARPFDAWATPPPSRNAIGDAGAAALAASPHVGRLDHLNLTFNDVGDDGARALAASTALAALRNLNLGNNQITGTGAQALADGRGLAALTRLTLGGNPIYSGEKEIWYDQGVEIGEGDRRMTRQELRAAYGKRFQID